MTVLYGVVGGVSGIVDLMFVVQVAVLRRLNREAKGAISEAWGDQW